MGKAGTVPEFEKISCKLDISRNYEPEIVSFFCNWIKMRIFPFYKASKVK
jgi:hypothetical protein